MSKSNEVEAGAFFLHVKAASLAVHRIYFFYTRNQFISKLCSDARKRKQLLRDGHPSLSNHPNTEYAEMSIFNSS